MKKTQTKLRKKATPEDKLLPDLAMLFKYEMSACNREEVIRMAVKLVASGKLDRFYHPLRRTIYDMAMAGLIDGVEVPKGYLEMSNDPDRPTDLHTTSH